MSEGAPKNDLKLEKTGVGPGGYPEYKVVRNPETESTDDSEKLNELTPEEIEEMENEKPADLDNIPGELTAKKRQVLRAVLASLGISLMPMKEGNDAEAYSDPEMNEYSINELAVDNQPVDVHIDRDQFTAAVGERLDDPEKFMSEFDKRVKAASEKITEWDVAKTMEFANRPVVGAEDYTRARYVSEAMEFAKWNPETGEGIPPALEAELRKILPGLCAQESRFDADSESSAGAKGILQIMPENWKKFGGQPGQEKSLKAQVEVAGKILSAMYRQLNNNIDEAILDQIRAHFPSDEAFQIEFELPALLNSYNAGDGTVAEAITGYVRDTDPADWPAAEDLYSAIGDYARLNDEGYLRYYKDHSHNYTYQVIAMAEKINRG